jgi:hypothetical protein
MESKRHFVRSAAAAVSGALLVVSTTGAAYEGRVVITRGVNVGKHVVQSGALLLASWTAR